MVSPLVALLLFLPQAGGGGTASPAAPARKSVHVARAPRAPVIDGVLEDEAWAQAAVITDFVEVDPDEGDPADPPTELRLMRDADFLYLGVTCFEPEPEKMVLQNALRDAFLNDDDRFEFILDTFEDGKNAFFFQVSAAGERGDGLINDNGRRFNKNWDTFWKARMRISKDRWTAEIAIPFKGLSFSGKGVWRANFERFRGADRTRTRWASPLRKYRLFTVSVAGELEGMEGLDQGLGIEVVPFYKVRRNDDEVTNLGNTVGTLGGEINWRITSQLRGSLTFNTDFAETEADARRVNLTRFPLFFPEKRDFFLQDSTFFQFGEQVGFRSRPNLIPFFTRRIGLARSGDEVPIHEGARVAGRVGNLDLGALAVSTGKVRGAGVPRGDIFVVRPSYNVSDELSVGALFTSGNPEDKGSNFVTGVDTRFASTDLLPGNFSLNVYALRSSDEVTGDVGAAYGMQSSLRTRDWNFSFDTLTTQKAFQPSLGFVRRPGERRYASQVMWEPRPDEGPVRRYIFGIQPVVWTDLSGELQSHRTAFNLFGVELHDGDQFMLSTIFEGDRLDQPFFIVPGSKIPTGGYDWWTVQGQVRFSDARPLSGRIVVEGGSFYNGSIGRLRVSANWRPSAFFRFGLSYREDRADLPGGDFDTRIEIVNANFSFTPDLSLENLIQADNQSDVLGIQSRLRWIEADGRELFFVVNSAWRELPGGTIIPLSRDFTLKLLYSLRF